MRSLAKNSDMKPEYLSASVQECIRAVEREINLREENAKLKRLYRTAEVISPE